MGFNSAFKGLNFISLIADPPLMLIQVFSVWFYLPQFPYHYHHHHHLTWRLYWPWHYDWTDGAVWS